MGAHGAEIQQLQKDLAQKVEAQKEATKVRDKENALFEEDKTENEQCLGALEQAIKVMTGAGAGKKGFLETMQEAQLLSIVGGVRDVVSKPTVTCRRMEQSASGGTWNWPASDKTNLMCVSTMS